MKLLILGPGCARCKRVEEFAREAATTAGVVVEIEHVKELERMLEFDVMATPAVVLDGTVRSSGRVPTVAELAEWMTAAKG